MAFSKEDPARGAAAGLPQGLSFDGDISPIAQNSASVQAAAAITALRRDFIAEALRVVAVKAAHAADDVEIGDDICAARGISIVIAHVKEAASAFREMQNADGAA